MKFVQTQANIPQTVGNINAITVSLMLPVSAFMVLSVVAQGKCKSEKSITFTAVSTFQPLSLSRFPRAETEEASIICADDR